MCTVSRGNGKPSIAVFAGNVIHKHLSEDYFFVCLETVHLKKKKAMKSIGPEADPDTSEDE